MLKRKSILVSSVVAVLVLVGCGDHKGPLSHKKDGADVVITKFSAVGNPPAQKVVIEEGQQLVFNLRVENHGNLDAEALKVSGIMRNNKDDNNTLTFEQELTGLLEPLEVYKQNVFVDGTDALSSGEYDTNIRIITTSKDVNQSNNYSVRLGKSVKVIIK